MGKRISIIVPVYNAAKTVEYTVGSVLTAGFGGDCELILVDDGSSDGSSEICDSLCSLAPGIRTIHQPNSGVSAARNAGMDLAGGEYLMFLDSDDLLPQTALEHCRKALDISPDIVIGGYSMRSVSGNTVSRAPLLYRLYSEWELPMFWDDNYSCDGSYLRPVWGKLFLRSLVYGGEPLRFQKSLSYGEDFLFLFSYLCRCRKVLTLSDTLYIYRDGGNGLSADLCSDRHLHQLIQLTGLYSGVAGRLRETFPQSRAVSGLYHDDLVGRLVCRALTVFSTRKTVLCTSDNISRFYSLMRADASLGGLKGLFSLRAGQIPNLLLFKIGSPRFSEKVYRISAAFCELFHLRPKRY
ncbi:MAG: glycosyltransferase family 2 protein [Candidatus Cryptobacteroides sp.]